MIKERSKKTCGHGFIKRAKIGNYTLFATSYVLGIPVRRRKP